MKHLRDISPKKDFQKNQWEGDNSSEVSDGSTGSDPDIDYEPKAGGEQDFVKKHKVAKFKDRVGNKDDVYNGTNVKYALDTPQNTRMGLKKKDAEAQYEEVEDEEIELDETSKKKVARYIEKAVSDYGDKRAEDSHRMDREIRYGSTSDTEKEGKHLFNKRVNRVVGINRALRRLTKEETELDELSNTTLRRYSDANFDQNRNIRQELKVTKGSQSKELFKKLKKRREGTYSLNRAVVRNKVDYKHSDEYDVKTPSRAYNSFYKEDTDNKNKKDKHHHNYSNVAKKPKSEKPKMSIDQLISRYQHSPRLHNHLDTEETEIDEKITSKTPTSKIIHDFVYSKNKMFSGDSKKERIRRALGAKYSMLYKEGDN